MPLFPPLVQIGWDEGVPGQLTLSNVSEYELATECCG